MTEIIRHLELKTEFEKVAQTYGGEYAGPCPFCGGEDRFRVWPEEDSMWCRQCDYSGDLIDYIQERDSVGFVEACEEIGVDPNRVSDSTSTVNHSTKYDTTKPDESNEDAETNTDKWQEQAERFTKQCRKCLWTKTGKNARQWLLNRTLNKSTLRAANIGYNPNERYQAPGKWGLEPDNDVWLPRGIVIPWKVNGEYPVVDIRRAVTTDDDLKYYNLPGSSNSLYNGDTLMTSDYAVLVESELDAVLVNQETQDSIRAVATGSAGWSRKPEWIAWLSTQDTVLVAFDRDDAGDDATYYWVSTLDNAKEWRPPFGDVTDLAISGVDIDRWIRNGFGMNLERKQTENVPKTIPRHDEKPIRDDEVEGEDYLAPERVLEDVLPTE